MSELPLGWDWLPLGDAGTWHGGGTPSKANSSFWEEGTIPWVSPKDMRSEVLLDSEDKITAAAVEGSAATLVDGPSIAIVVRSGILARLVPTAVVPFAATFNQDMKALQPMAGLETRYVARAFQWLEPSLRRDCRKAGTTVASLDATRLMAVRLPVAPLAEQRRIVEALDDHLSRLDAAETLIARTINRLESLRRSVLLTTVDGPADAEPWPRFRLGDLATVGTGATPLRSEKSFYEGGTIPWVTSGQLHADVVTAAEQFITERALAETSVRRYPAGTLLIAMYGEGKTRGTCSELGISATTNQAIAAIVLHPQHEHLRPWVKAFLRSNYEAMRRLAAGGVQPNLNLGLVRDLAIPVPDAETRAARLEALEATLTQIARLQLSITVAQQHAVALRRSLLETAFSGRLVPQDPVDEPASVLLERIAAERVGRSQAKRRKPIKASA